MTDSLSSKVTLLPYESEIFGTRVIQIENQNQSERDFYNQLDQLKEADFGAVIVKDKTLLLTKEALSSNVFSVGYFGTTLTYRKVVQNTNFIVPSDFKFLRCKTSSQPLISLSIASAEYSRFKLDSKMPRFSHVKMYSDWIDKSVRGEFDDHVFGVFTREELVAMITSRNFGPDLRIGLVSVSDNYKNMGIGSLLLSCIIEIARNNKKETVTVSTQLANKRAVHLYEKNGFNLIEQTRYIHLWRNLIEDQSAT